jgi:hypothetical protein
MLPAYAWVLSIVTILGAVATVATAVHVAVRRSGVTAAVAGALIGWTLLVSVLADQGVFRAGPGNPVPWIGVAILVEVGGLLAAARLPFARRMVAEPATLTLLHVFRIPAGVMFLLLAAADRLPAVFALPAGIGDVAIGIAAPFVARRLARDPRARTVVFQVLGAADLICAVTLGFAVSPGPYRLIDASPDGSILAMLPVSLVPTAAVPIAFVAHVLMLSRRSGHEEPSPSGRQGRSRGHQAGTARR